MKAKELATELLLNPDFEVEIRTSLFSEMYGFNFIDVKITGLCDINYSDKKILLEGEVK